MISHLIPPSPILYAISSKSNLNQIKSNQIEFLNCNLEDTLLKKSFGYNVLCISFPFILLVSKWFQSCFRNLKISNLHFFLGSHTNTATCTNKYLFLLLDQEELEERVGARSLSWKLIQDHSLRPALHVILNIDGHL